MSMRVGKRSFILATLVGIGDLGIARKRSSYQDPAQVFTVFRGLRSSQLDLDSMHPVECIRLEAMSSLGPR